MGILMQHLPMGVVGAKVLGTLLATVIILLAYSLAFLDKRLLKLALVLAVMVPPTYWLGDYSGLAWIGILLLVIVFLLWKQYKISKREKELAARQELVSPLYGTPHSVFDEIKHRGN